MLPAFWSAKSCTYHKAGDWADDAYPIYYELQLRFYLAVADVEIGAFSTIWGTIRSMIWQCRRLPVTEPRRI